MISAWPLMGRERELRVVERSLQGADDARGLMLGGAAGVGKTRLAREALAIAAANGCRVYWTAATASGRDLPLGAFADMCHQFGPDPLRRVEEVIDALTEPGRPGTAVVAVDDADRLDDLSAFVVQQLVVRRRARVLLTVRSGAGGPEAISTLWKDRLLRRLEVRPLARAELRALLEAVLDGPVDSDSARSLWALTRGNALYATELIDSELATSRLRQRAGVWLWDGPGPLPRSLRELIESRIGTLPREEADVLDLLALVEPLEVRTLARVGPLDSIEAAEADGLITIGSGVDGQLLVRLAHPLLGEVRRAALGSVRGRRLRGLLAAELDREWSEREGPERQGPGWHTPTRPESLRGDSDYAHGLVRRAALSLDSDQAPDPPLLVAAAHAAMELLDPNMAGRFALAACRGRGSVADRVLRGTTLMLRDRGEAAEAEFAPLADAVDTSRDRIWVATLRAANQVWILGSPRRASAILDEAAPVPAAAAQPSTVSAIRASVASVLGRPREAIAFARTSLGLTWPGSPSPGSASLPDIHAMMAHGALVLSHGAVGELEQSRAAAQRAYQLAARSAETAHFRFWIGALQARALRLGGLLREAADDGDRLRAEAANAPGLARPQTALLLGHAHLGLGQLADAVRWLREAHATALATKSTSGLRVACLTWLTEALALSGDADAAAETLAELEAIRYPEFAFMNTAIAIARAWTDAAGGAISEAIALLRAAEEGARRRGQLANEVMILQARAQIGDPAPADRLQELSARVQGPRVHAVAAHVAALAAGDGAALEAASARYEEMGERIASADAAAQAFSAYTHAHRRGPALTASANAYRLAEHSQGARTPALREVTRPTALTARQREIVAMASRGLTNRQIAERLVVSVRTVEGHLYRASVRTGVAGREELAAIIREG